MRLVIAVRGGSCSNCKNHCVFIIGFGPRVSDANSEWIDRRETDAYKFRLVIRNKFTVSLTEQRLGFSETNFPHRYVALIRVFFHRILWTNLNRVQDIPSQSEYAKIDHLYMIYITMKRSKSYECTPKKF